MFVLQERDECRGKLRQMTFELEYLHKSDRVRTTLSQNIYTKLLFTSRYALTCRKRASVWRSTRLSWLQPR